MNIIVQEPPDGQECSAECRVPSAEPQNSELRTQNSKLVLLPGAEVCETRPYSTLICFEVRRAGTCHSHFRFWHAAWFPTRCVTGPPMAVEGALVTQALEELSIRNHGYQYEAVLEDRGQRPGDAR